MSAKEIPLIILGTLRSYARCAQEASKALIKNWIVLPAVLVAFIAFMLVAGFVSQLPLGIAGGFIVGMLQIALLTLYYGWLSQSVAKSKLRAQELLNFEYALFSSIIGVGFILFVAEFMLMLSLQNPSTRWILPVIQLAICIIFNPVAEIIHQQRGDGIPSLKAAYEFVMENWIEWFVPFFAMLLPWIWINAEASLFALSGTDLLLPASSLIRGTKSVIDFYGGSGLSSASLFLGVIVAHWFMLFRAFLFQDLSLTTRRKRMYQLKNN